MTVTDKLMNWVFIFVILVEAIVTVHASHRNPQRIANNATLLIVPRRYGVHNSNASVPVPIRASQTSRRSVKVPPSYLKKRNDRTKDGATIPAASSHASLPPVDENNVDQLIDAADDGSYFPTQFQVEIRWRKRKGVTDLRKPPASTGKGEVRDNEKLRGRGYDQSIYRLVEHKEEIHMHRTGFETEQERDYHATGDEANRPIPAKKYDANNVGHRAKQTLENLGHPGLEKPTVKGEHYDVPTPGFRVDRTFREWAVAPVVIESTPDNEYIDSRFVPRFFALPPKAIS